MDEIDSRRLDQRHHQRSQDDQGRAALKEHAHDEQGDIQDQEDQVLVGSDAADRLEKRVRDVLPGEIIPEEVCRDDDQHDRAGAGDGLAENGNEVLLFQTLIDKLADDEAVENAHAAGFSRGEETHAHAHDDSEREEQCPEGVQCLLGDDLGGGLDVAARCVTTLLSDDVDGHHKRQCHDKAREVACGKELADRSARNQTIDDQVDAGRDNRRDAGGGGRDRGGEALAVSALFHLGDQHLAFHRGIRVGGAGAAAHQHAEQHVDLCQTARPMPGQRVGKGHQLVAHACVVHDGAGHDEEGNREEREGLRRGNELLQQQIDLGGRIHKSEVVKRTRHQRVGDGDSGEVQHQGDDNRKVHGHVIPRPPSVRRESDHGYLPSSAQGNRWSSGRIRAAGKNKDSSPRSSGSAWSSPWTSA